MHADDNQCHHDVAKRHEGHDDLRKVSDALDAAEDDDAEHGDHDQGRRQLGETDVAEAGLQHAIGADRQFHSVANGVRLHGG